MTLYGGISHLPSILIIAGRKSMVRRALMVIIPAIKSPTVIYGVSGANIMTEKAEAKRIAFLIIPLPGRAAVQRIALSTSRSSAYLC